MIPAGIVLAGNFIIIKKFFEKDAQERFRVAREENKKKSVPMRIQAYERLVLYLERIDPNNSIIATYKGGMSAKLLQSELTKQIRSEFDHNMSQQLFISDQGWEAVKKAKEETVKIINIAAQQTGEDGSGIDLSNRIYEIISQIEALPTDIASKILKREARKLF